MRIRAEVTTKKKVDLETIEGVGTIQTFRPRERVQVNDSSRNGEETILKVRFTEEAEDKEVQERMKLEDNVDLDLYMMNQG